MKTESKTFKLTFTTRLMGTKPNNPEIFLDHIAAKAPDPDKAGAEAALIPAQELETHKTVFFRDEAGAVCIMDYQVKGFLKEVLGVLTKFGSVSTCYPSAVKGVVDKTIFINPLMIHILDPEGRKITGSLPAEQRPISREVQPDVRETFLGITEIIAPGHQCVVEIEVNWGEPARGKSASNYFTMDDVINALAYGGKFGMGQWRSGGNGKFRADLLLA